MNEIVYNKAFYLNQMNESKKSAREIIPMLFDIYKPNSVIDVGCGTGAWLSEFKNAGVENVLGMDGDYVNRELLMIDKNEFLAQDLNGDFGDKINNKFDMAMSLEVAEHIEYKNAKKFVKSIINFSDFILFSAAIPYQGGTEHINENWIEYWSTLFREYDFYPIDYFRDKIWSNTNICWWYRQNIMIYVRKDKIEKFIPGYDFEKELPKTYIHPELFLWACVREREKSNNIYINDLKYYNDLVKNYQQNQNIDSVKKYKYTNEFNVEFTENKSFIKRIKRFFC